MGAEPRVRARHMKALLAAVERLPPREAAIVLEGVAQPTRATIADATSVDWLPGALNLEVTRALYQGLGPQGGERFFRSVLAESFSGPLLKVVVEAALRVFRADAGSFAGWVGKGWPLVFRDCGRWTVERAGEREALLRIEDLPPAFAQDEFWLGSVGHSLSAFFDVARTTGSVGLEQAEPAAGRAHFRLVWR